MNDQVFFDTNILLYAIGQHDGRTPTAEALLANGGLISVQGVKRTGGSRAPKVAGWKAAEAPIGFMDDTRPDMAERHHQWLKI